MNKKILIVGAGFYGATCARLLTDKGYDCTVIDSRNHIGGNCYTQEVSGIHVHTYGPHIFHTDNKGVLDFVSKFTEFSYYNHNPRAFVDGELLEIPVNLGTINFLYGINSPEEAKLWLKSETKPFQKSHYNNFEERALSLVGEDLYLKFYKYYTEKQWGRPATEVPAFIAERLPVRTTFNSNYFHHSFQGIPKNGYTALFENMLDGIKVNLNVDFFDIKVQAEQDYGFIIYTGPIDKLFNGIFGDLAYRSLRFEESTYEIANLQGTSIVNYPGDEFKYTRIVEHKNFYPNNKEIQEKPITIVTREYPSDEGDPYYPINDRVNDEMFNLYRNCIPDNYHVGGRLGLYKYMDMDVTISKAMDFCNQFNF